MCSMWCRVSEVETKYYADGENAFCMKKTFKKSRVMATGNTTSIVEAEKKEDASESKQNRKQLAMATA